MKFSIIVVCLNSGHKLNQTLQSILSQSYEDFEIVVKDGGSRDGSIEGMLKDPRIHLYTREDGGIYDAMNQAVTYAQGEFILFLNCGDVFPTEHVLEETVRYMEEAAGHMNAPEDMSTPEDMSATEDMSTPVDFRRAVFYGDTYSEKNDVLIVSPPKITGFGCYRNIPCHQSCFYAAELCREKPYDEQYRVRADYDHFLWCFYEAKASMHYMKLTVASYEGGGFSESRENRKRDMEEHRRITGTYMSKGELLKYRLIMWCTLAPLRRLIAESRHLSGIYHGLKKLLYGGRG